MDVKKLKETLTAFLKTVRKKMADPSFMGEHNFEIEESGKNLKIKFHNTKLQQMNAFIINVDIESGKITPDIKLIAEPKTSINYTISFDELCQRMMDVINELKGE
jgi:hypothetical protein